METGLGGLRLPNIMGRKFSRPRVVEFQVGSCKRSLRVGVPLIVWR